MVQLRSILPLIGLAVVAGLPHIVQAKEPSLRRREFLGHSHNAPQYTAREVTRGDLDALDLLSARELVDTLWSDLQTRSQKSARQRKAQQITNANRHKDKKSSTLKATKPMNMNAIKSMKPMEIEGSNPLPETLKKPAPRLKSDKPKVIMPMNRKAIKSMKPMEIEGSNPLPKTPKKWAYGLGSDPRLEDPNYWEDHDLYVDQHKSGYWGEGRIGAWATGVASYGNPPPQSEKVKPDSSHPPSQSGKQQPKSKP